ncbi:neuroligin-4, Y-linked-like [Pollicipes pollicipes]|uniref:neuroligin-4, Y-linked-like n=1 Tax=Pollicipes pollicipes TaxID=41117 RepID=UPI001884EF22|nr:neuroligin-4, Y-linked-like [Pollicipes pollicipes]
MTCVIAQRPLRVIASIADVITAIADVTTSIVDVIMTIKTDYGLVTTEYGQLQGYLRSFQRHQVAAGHALRPVNVFLGVPYATPPVGSNRFSPTRTPSPWRGVRSAMQPGRVCPQQLPPLEEADALRSMPRAVFERVLRLRGQLANQSEDCLYLNIYAPAHRGADLYPVMVYIHGDSYLWSSGNLYDGGVLASYGEVVVVAINYRLGLFGFLNTNVERGRARVTNNGLLDQIAALHWIQENVQEFGGDPDKVTLFGHGTGAACVSFLLNSPAVVTNLFHRAIVMSGSSLSGLSAVQDPAQYAVALGRRVGCPVPGDLRLDHELLVDCLREQNAERLLAADVGGYQFLPTFGPSVDGVVVQGQVRRRVRKNHGRVYDLMFGVAERDAFTLLSDEDVRGGVDAARRDRLLRTFVRNSYCYSNVEIFYSIINAYTNWSSPRRHAAALRDETIAALSDAAFVAPVTADAELHAPAEPVEPVGRDGDSTYFYVFSYERAAGAPSQQAGSVHGSEIPYVFGRPLVQETTGASQFRPEDITISEMVMTFWTNFAKTGDPNRPAPQPPPHLPEKERSRYRAWRLGALRPHLPTVYGYRSEVTHAQSLPGSPGGVLE